MDDKGFIFTADATLALVVFIVFTASIVTYYMLPFFMGEDHQHLEALASDALDVMQQDGTLYTAAGKYASGNTSGAESILTPELNSLIPSNIAYKITIGDNSLENNKGIIVPRDSATALRVTSGPNETWLGRASYENNSAFTNVNYDNTVTLWNFHNWLGNFGPWKNNFGKFSFRNANATTGNSVNIPFSAPAEATITGTSFILGMGELSPNSQFRFATLNLNGHNHNALNASFTFLNKKANSGSTPAAMFSYYNGTISGSEINPGNNNNFWVNFNFLGTVGNGYIMPWFSLIADYTTPLQVPAGTNINRYNFNDAGGLAVPNPNGTFNLTQYNPQTGSVTNSTSSTSVMNWNTFVTNRNTLNSYSNGMPFVMYNVPNGVGNATAVSVTQNINIPSGTRVLDGYVNLNAYGGVDHVLVEVKNDNTWQTVFCSFDFDGKSYSARNDGYGNIPGTLYIGDYLKSGDNQVRITVWDQYRDLSLDTAPDYDLVGLIKSYATVTTSNLPVRWETFALNSYQALETQSNDAYTFPDSNGRQFSIGKDAKNAYMFIGAGLNSRNLKVEVKNSTGSWQTLYTNSTIPYSIDLAAKDINGPKVFTSGTPGNYTLNPGNYRVRVTIKASTNSECGDGSLNPISYTDPSGTFYPGGGNPAVFSGTRVAILYPTQTISAVAYNSTAAAAQETARNNLAGFLGISPADPNIHTEALFTGNSLNGIPVRLDLWRE